MTIPPTSEEIVENAPLKEEENSEVLRSVSTKRVLIPIAVGLAAVGYLIWRNFDVQELNKIQWNARLAFFTAAAIVFAVLRHLFFSWRIHIVSNGLFDKRKSVIMMLIFEFSAAVAPTTMAGSALSFLALKQEGVSSGRTAAMLTYFIVTDSFFFALLLPIFYLLLGPIVIGPGIADLSDLSGWEYAFLSGYLLMTAYGSVFFFGIFISPDLLRRLLVWVFGFSLLRRFRDKAEQLGKDLATTSKEIRKQPFSFHLKAFSATLGGWSSRFLVLICLIYALEYPAPRAPGIDNATEQVMLMYARQEAMLILQAISPTPGGSGVAEVTLLQFHQDYISKGKAALLAIPWRFLTYYIYLLLGVFFIPRWLNEAIARRRAAKAATQAAKV